jgi:hypothetical protein
MIAHVRPRSAQPIHLSHSCARRSAGKLRRRVTISQRLGLFIRIIKPMIVSHVQQCHGLGDPPKKLPANESLYS